MIKILRQRRSKDKQFVIWESLGRKEENVPVNNSFNPL